MAGEMNETMDKSAPRMEITEKRAHRLGGCAGIFFQLFDWNRRFANEKLFSRKSLAPGAKQASKRFGGNEKVLKSKRHLIADENRGGFPNLKKKSDFTSECMEGKNEMKTPGLVARLMGLESMPAIRKDKHKKISSVQAKHNMIEEKQLNRYNVVGREDLSLERSKPQKLQKTGMSDRLMVSRIGSEALQIKNVLSRVRKHHHHHKLPTPVRSPRLSTTKRSSRLIDAAARILEPGLQKATSRAKCALTYSNSLHRPSGNKVVANGLGVISPECGYNVTSCRNCGSLVGVVNSGTVANEKPFVFPNSVFNSVNVSFPDVDKSITNCFKASAGQEQKDVINHDQCKFLSFQGNEKEQPTTNHKGRPQKNAKSFAFKNEVEAQNQILQRERFPRDTRLCNLRSMRASPDVKAISVKDKDFAAFNRGSSSRTRPRFQAKDGNFDIEMEKKSCKTLEDSGTSALRTPMRKRRISSVNGQAQSAGYAGPISEKHNVRDHTCINISSFSQRDRLRVGGDKESNGVSNMSKSPTREKARFCRAEKERRGAQKDPKTPKLKQCLKEDALGGLPYQKLKELTCQGEDEMATRGNLARKSTAMIIRELVSRDCRTWGTNIGYRAAVGKREMGSLGFAANSDYMSPGSVLEASFSNESCFSSSFDDSSGRRLYVDSVDTSYDHPQRSETDADLLEDSATSLKKPVTNYWTITRLFDHVACLLQCMNDDGLGLTKLQLSHAKEVMFNTELLFGTGDFLLNPSLLDDLTNLAGAVCKSSDYFHVLTRGFLLDCLIEHLDSRYGGFINSGYEAWRKLPLFVNVEMLVREILEETMSWTMFGGLPPNEIIEFDAEAFEVGVEIGCGLLHGLIDEVVVDLSVCGVEFPF